MNTCLFLDSELENNQEFNINYTLVSQEVTTYQETNFFLHTTNI